MKVVETLYRCVCVCVCVYIFVSFFSFSMRYFDQAAVFLESCLEYGLIKRNEETSTDTIYHPLIFSLHSLPSFFSTPLLSLLSLHSPSHRSFDRSCIPGVCTLSWQPWAKTWHAILLQSSRRERPTADGGILLSSQETSQLVITLAELCVFNNYY